MVQEEKQQDEDVEVDSFNSKTEPIEKKYDLEARQELVSKSGMSKVNEENQQHQATDVSQL